MSHPRLGFRGVSRSAYELPMNLDSSQKCLASLPQRRSVPVDIAEVVPPADRDVIANFEFEQSQSPGPRG